VRPEPLITDRAVLAASITMVRALLEPLRGLIAGIESFDQQIAASYEQHPDKEVFGSLPGADPVLAPRLLAAFGADRERYQTAEEIQCFSGIAPVIERSGKTKFVDRRLACPVVRPPELPRIRPEFDPLVALGAGLLRSTAATRPQAP
jgi:transposase